MQPNLVGLVSLMVGGVLIYSAMKNVNPVEVIKSALKGKTVAPGSKVVDPQQSRKQPKTPDKKPAPAIVDPQASYYQGAV